MVRQGVKKATSNLEVRIRRQDTRDGATFRDFATHKISGSVESPGADSRHVAAVIQKRA